MTTAHLDMEDYKNIQLVCFCGKPFEWSVGEQKFLQDLYDKGKIPSVAIPKRCPSCRAKNREKKSRQQYHNEEGNTID